MAEYLCEEDMSTGEYISRDLALRQLNATCLATDCNNYNGVWCRACAYADAMDFIDAIPAADVQSVPQWISVKDRLPETNAIGVAHVLAYDRYEGVVKADFLDEFANYHYGSNLFQISNTSTQLYKVTHWQPLPEPPKDDDVK